MCLQEHGMESKKYQKGEISLTYLFKIGFCAFISMSVNSIFDYVSNSVLTYKVQIMTTSPQVRHVKQCVFDNVMEGRISSLADCSASGAFESSDAPVTVSFDGEIKLKEVIEGNQVTVTLKPVFRGAQVIWECSGSPAKYMPSSCNR